MYVRVVNELVRKMRATRAIYFRDFYYYYYYCLSLFHEPSKEKGKEKKSEFKSK